MKIYIFAASKILIQIMILSLSIRTINGCALIVMLVPVLRFFWNWLWQFKSHRAQEMRNRDNARLFFVLNHYVSFLFKERETRATALYY